MSSEPSISVKSLSKHFLMFDKPEDRLKQMILPKLHRLAGMKERNFYREFSAVNNVDLEVARGETVGIVGRNGSGKSTLLQIICGTLQPSFGEVSVNGRIAALLELGSGFNPEFTGRENVYFNAAILGLSREETEARFDAIASFAEVGAFMDQPVKTYSSGMYVRLAFAVATNVDPDILIVDEALAVGDEAFQRKCFARIDEIKARGATILFVSHAAQSVIQLCDRAILMDRGENILEGRPKAIINQYQRMMNLTGDAAEAVRESIRQLNANVPDADDSDTGEEIAQTREPADADGSAEAWFDPELVSKSLVEYETKGARIKNIRIVDQSGNQVNNLVLYGSYKFCYQVEFTESLFGVNFAMFVKTLQGIEVAGQHAFPPEKGMSVDPDDTIEVSLPFLCSFLPGTYSCNCGVFMHQGGRFEILHRFLDGILFRVIPTDSGYSRQGIVDICPGNEPVMIAKISSRQAV